MTAYFVNRQVSSLARVTAPESSTPFWLYEFYGMPLWMIIVLAILGIALPVFGRAGRRGGGRSGGGGSGGKW